MITNDYIFATRGAGPAEVIFISLRLFIKPCASISTSGFVTVDQDGPEFDQFSG